MIHKDDESGRAAKLRWRAEEIARRKDAAALKDIESLSPLEIRRTIHELQVNQIQLKMQNEELRRTYEELEAARARYFDLYDLAPVGYCVVSLEGLILEANLTAVNLLSEARAALVKQPITRFIFREDQDIYYLHRKEFLKTGEPFSCELRMVKKDGSTFWTRLTVTAAPDPSSDGIASISRVVLSDITERKLIEEEKARLEAKLIQLHYPVGPKNGSGEGGRNAVGK